MDDRAATRFPINTRSCASWAICDVATAGFRVGTALCPPTSAIIRQFVETILSIAMVFILGDLIRDPQTLRRLVIAVMFAISVQAIIAIVLYVLPDQTAE